MGVSWNPHCPVFLGPEASGSSTAAVRPCVASLSQDKAGGFLSLCPSDFSLTRLKVSFCSPLCPLGLAPSWALSLGSADTLASTLKGHRKLVQSCCCPARVWCCECRVEAALRCRMPWGAFVQRCWQRSVAWAGEVTGLSLVHSYSDLRHPPICRV